MRRKTIRGMNGELVTRFLPENEVDVLLLRSREQNGDDELGRHSFADDPEAFAELDELDDDNQTDD